MRDGLSTLRWTERELPQHRKGDGAKVKLAMERRAETTMTFRRITARLRIVTGASL